MFATKGAKFIHDSRCTWMKLYIATVEDCRMMSPGWWYTYPSDPSENYEFVSWDDEIPNIWKNKIYVPKPPTRHCLGGSTHANDFLYIFLLSRSEKLKRKPAQNWAGATFTSSTKWKWQGPNPEESYTTLPSAYVKTVMEKSTCLRGKSWQIIYFYGPFSTAMANSPRVS